jgi:hypothetical protein
VLNFDFEKNSSKISELEVLITEEKKKNPKSFKTICLYQEKVIKLLSKRCSAFAQEIDQMYSEEYFD